MCLLFFWGAEEGKGLINPRQRNKFYVPPHNTRFVCVQQDDTPENTEVTQHCLQQMFINLIIVHNHKDTTVAPTVLVGRREREN